MYTIIPVVNKFVGFLIYIGWIFIYVFRWILNWVKGIFGILLSNPVLMSENMTGFIHQVETIVIYSHNKVTFVSPTPRSPRVLLKHTDWLVVRRENDRPKTSSGFKKIVVSRLSLEWRRVRRVLHIIK